VHHVRMHVFDARLQALRPGADPQERLAVVWQFYEEATGHQLACPVTETQRRAVHAFLRDLQKEQDSPVLHIRRQHLEAPIALNLVEKAARLVQQPCTACELFMREDGTFPLSTVFPIQVRPWAAQSRHDRVAIREAVAAELAERGTFSPWEGRLCLTIVSLVPRASRSKDVDNLVKGLIDSMQGSLYVDDKQIQCLTSRRIEYAGEVGYYHVSARAVLPWDSDVVYDDPASPVIRSGRKVLNTNEKEKKL